MGFSVSVGGQGTTRRVGVHGSESDHISCFRPDFRLRGPIRSCLGSPASAPSLHRPVSGGLSNPAWSSATGHYITPIMRCRCEVHACRSRARAGSLLRDEGSHGERRAFASAWLSSPHRQALGPMLEALKEDMRREIREVVLRHAPARALWRACLRQKTVARKLSGEIRGNDKSALRKERETSLLREPTFGQETCVSFPFGLSISANIEGACPNASGVSGRHSC